MSNTKERPILFSGEMVRAILDGRKTQTRRLVKLPVIDRYGSGCEIAGCELQSCLNQGLEICPYGIANSRLWVRETFAAPWGQDYKTIFYRADNPEKMPNDGSWSPSIHMPRKLSRITMEITRIRVQRLNDISARDCEAEGLFFNGSSYSFLEKGPFPFTQSVWSSQKQCFYRLWENINGSGSWAKNPWVWVIEFNRLSADSRYAIK